MSQSLLKRTQDWTPRRWLWGIGLLLFGITIAWKVPTESYQELWHGVGLVLGTLIFSVGLAYVLKPGVDFFSGRVVGRFAVSRFWAALLVFLLAGVVLGALIHFGIVPVVVEIGKLTRKLPALREELPARIDQLLTAYGGVTRSYFDLQARINDLTQSLFEGIQRGAVVTVSWIPLVVELLLIPILAFYFLVDTPHLLREMVLLFPVRHRDVVFSVFRQVDKAMEHYIHGQVLLCLLAALVVTVGLAFLKVDFALTLGLIAGLTRAIPVMGPVFGGIPIVIFVWIDLGLATATTVLIFFSLLHLIESKVIMPRLIGHELELHPAVVIIALLIGKEFFGLLGMFLAPPITALIRMFLLRYRHEVALKEARLR